MSTGPPWRLGSAPSCGLPGKAAIGKVIYSVEGRTRRKGHFANTASAALPYACWTTLPAKSVVWREVCEEI